MLHRLCAPVNSFEFQPCDRTPQVDYLSLSLSLRLYIAENGNHRLQRGLPGYLILFDPHAFVRASIQASELPSLSVFCVISMHFTATLHIPPTSTEFKMYSINGSSAVKLQDFTTDLYIRLRTL